MSPDPPGDTRAPSLSGPATVRPGAGMITALPRPIRFALVGVVNTLVGLGSIFALKAFLGLGDIEANALGFLAGLGCSFFLNRRWTFEHSGAVFGAAWRFALVFCAAYVANLLTMLGVRDALHIDAYAAHTAGAVVYTVCFYCGSRWFAFREHDR